MGILSSIWKFIKKWWWLILLILIIIFIWFPGTWALLAAFFSSAWAAVVAWPIWGAIGSLGLWKGLALGFGLLAIINPEEATRVVENVVEVASSVVDGALDVIGTALSSPLVLIGGGLFLWWLLSKDDDGPTYIDPTYQGDIQ